VSYEGLRREATPARKAVGGEGEKSNLKRKSAVEEKNKSGGGEAISNGALRGGEGKPPPHEEK